MKKFLIYVNITRILASLLSIAGGYIYTKELITLIFPDNKLIPDILTSIFLIIVEIGGVLFLYVTIKEIVIKKRFPFLYIIPAVAFMSLSFILTTNGAVLWLKHKKDATAVISNNYDIVRNNKTKKFNDEISRNKFIYDSIANVKLHKWKTARIMQTTKLQFYASEISRLENEKNTFLSEQKEKYKADISENKNQVKKYSSKYYSFAFIIMLAVFWFNFMHVFLKNKNNSIKKDIERGLKNNISFTKQDRIIGKKHIEEQIIEMLRSGKKGKDIAKELDVHPSKVSRLKTKFNIK